MVNKEQLKSFIEDPRNKKLITRKESKNYPGLFVLKYTRDVFYRNMWTPELEMCRGLVVDCDYNIIIRPFTKIYNRFERDTNFDDDDIVTAAEKKNGFMAAVTYVESERDCVVSTTGSLDSDYVALAKMYVEPYFPYIIDVYYRTGNSRPFTWLFEICSPDDPHIIPENEGAWLIGAQHCTYNDFKLPEGVLDRHAYDMNAPRPKWYRVRFGSLCDELKDCRHEGYVVHHDDGRSLKMKSPYYLVSKFLARCGVNKLDHILKHPDWTMPETVAEEFYPLIRHLMEMREDFIAMEEQQKLVAIREFLNK